MSAGSRQSVQSHHDVICIGFNTSAISFAIKLRESSPQTSLLFLERNSAQSWKPNDDLPAHMHMHTNFLNDLVTLQNPRSAFTFVNFLHQKKLLVDFTNLGAMEASRGLFEDYLAWCAGPFQNDVRYGLEILSIEPVHSAGKKIAEWNVFTKDKTSGERRIATASRVVICLDKEPEIPAFLSGPEFQQKVIEAAHSTGTLEELMLPTRKNVAIAIIGQSQEAAELFDFLYDARADRKVVWFNGTNIYGSESSTHSHPAIDVTDTKYPPELRATIAAETSPSISSKLSERIEEILYAQSVKQPDKQQWQYRTEPDITLQKANITPASRVALLGVDQISNQAWQHEFDLVVSANEIARQSPKPMLNSIISTRLLDGPQLTANANYHVNLRRGIVEQNVGLWCIGLFGQPEIAVGEAALTVTAERSARVVRDLLSRTIQKDATSPSRESKVQAQL